MAFVVGKLSKCFVHHIGRNDDTAPIETKLDCFMQHGAFYVSQCPFETGKTSEVVGFASVHSGELVFTYPKRIFWGESWSNVGKSIV